MRYLRLSFRLVILLGACYLALQLTAPLRASVIAGRGLALLQGKLFHLGMARIERSLSLCPSDGKVWYQKGCAYLEMAHAELGLKGTDSELAGVALFYETGTAQARRARSRRSHSLPKALEAFDTAQTCYRDYLLFEHLGEAHLLQDNPHAAIAAYQRALDYNPLSDEARKGLSQAWVARGDQSYAGGRVRDALLSYRRAAMVRSDDAVARCRWGMALWEAGRHEDAVVELLRAKELSPRDPLVRLGLLRESLREGRATDAARQAMTVLWRSGDEDRAVVEAVVKILSTSDQCQADPQLRYAMGFAYGRLGEGEKALDWYDGGSLREVPFVGKARELQQAGRTEDAARMYRRVARVYPGQLMAAAAALRLSGDHLSAAESGRLKALVEELTPARKRPVLLSAAEPASSLSFLVRGYDLEGSVADGDRDLLARGREARLVIYAQAVFPTDEVPSWVIVLRNKDTEMVLPSSWGTAPEEAYPRNCVFKVALPVVIPEVCDPGNYEVILHLLALGEPSDPGDLNRTHGLRLGTVTVDDSDYYSTMVLRGTAEERSAALRRYLWSLGPEDGDRLKQVLAAAEESADVEDSVMALAGAVGSLLYGIQAPGKSELSLAAELEREDGFWLPKLVASAGRERREAYSSLVAAHPTTAWPALWLLEEPGAKDLALCKKSSPLLSQPKDAIIGGLLKLWAFDSSRVGVLRRGETLRVRLDLQAVAPVPRSLRLVAGLLDEAGRSHFHSPPQAVLGGSAEGRQRFWRDQMARVQLSIEIPSGVPEGRYSLALAAVGDEGEPLNFASTGDDLMGDNHWLSLTQLKLE